MQINSCHYFKIVKFITSNQTVMKILLFWKPAIWLAAISYLSLVPGGNFPVIPLFNIPGFDKLVHFVFYFFLCVLLIKPLSKTTKFPYGLAAVFSVAFSGIIEILQAVLTVSRKGDITDLLANFMGVIAGLIVFRLIISGKPYEKFF
jgi:glycopeptide antibiotics resistance protein